MFHIEKHDSISILFKVIASIKYANHSSSSSSSIKCIASSVNTIKEIEKLLTLSLSEASFALLCHLTDPR